MHISLITIVPRTFGCVTLYGVSVLCDSVQTVFLRVGCHTDTLSRVTSTRPIQDRDRGSVLCSVLTDVSIAGFRVNTYTLLTEEYHNK